MSRYVQVSTDEVYGSLGPTGLFTEETPIAPNSPYSASKAAADLLVRSYCHTFGFPAITTRCSNNYGPYQFPEKIIPLFIANLCENKPVPVYGKGENVRDWIHVLDHCRGSTPPCGRAATGEVYNFGGHQEIKNIDLTLTLLELLGKPQIADRIRQGPAGARPALRHRLQQGRARAGLEAAGRFSQGNSRDDRLVSRPCGMGSPCALRRLSQVL